MLSYQISFQGGLLERGFWLYIWRIEYKGRVCYYVGRTGDSSSRYAASPFSRLSQHLDVRNSASANMLLRNIRAAGFNPLECFFEMTAFGPIFPEQHTLDQHRQFRDRIAPLESALAEYLRQRGLEVIGKHPSPGSVDQKIFSEVLTSVGKTILKGSN